MACARLFFSRPRLGTRSQSNRASPKAHPKSLGRSQPRLGGNPPQPIHSSFLQKPKRQRLVFRKPNTAVAGSVVAQPESQSSLVKSALVRAGEKWIKLLHTHASASMLGQTASESAHPKETLRASLRGYSPNSLQAYLRHLDTFTTYLTNSQLSLEHLSLAQFIDFLWICKDSQTRLSLLTQSCAQSLELVSPCRADPILEPPLRSSLSPSFRAARRSHRP